MAAQNECQGDRVKRLKDEGFGFVPLTMPEDRNPVMHVFDSSRSIVSFSSVDLASIVIICLCIQSHRFAQDMFS